MTILRRRRPPPQKSRTQFIRRVSEVEASRLRTEFQAATGTNGAVVFTSNEKAKLETVMTSEAVDVADLPTGALGMIAVVGDADTPSAGSTVVGGAAANALVWFNGTNWTVIGV